MDITFKQDYLKDLYHTGKSSDKKHRFQSASVNDVLNAKRPINAELALLIEVALDLPAEPLLKMQTRYNMLVAKRDGKFVEKLKNIRKIAAIF